jgi:hypothetical protein
VRITRLSVKNFLTFGESPGILVPRADRNILLGPNWSGKTSLFEAIDFVASSFGFPGPPLDPYRHRGNEAAEPDLEVRVQFSDSEIRALTDWMILAALTEQLNITQGTNELGESPDLGTARLLSRELMGHTRRVFDSLFSREIGFRVRGTGNPTRPLEAWIELRAGPDTLYVSANAGMTLTREWNGGGFLFDLRKEALKTLLAIAPNALDQNPATRAVTRAQISRAGRKFNLKWLVDGLRIPSQGTRFVQVRVINLREADSQERDAPSLGSYLNRFLQSRGYRPDSIGLRELFRLILSTSIVRLSNFRSPPNYYPEESFDQIPIHFEQLNGWELPAALWRLKDSPERPDRERFDRVRSVFKAVSDGIEVDVVLESEQVTPHVPATNAATENVIPLPKLPSSAPPPTYRQFPRIRFFDKPYEFDSPFASAGLYESLLLVFTAFESEGAVVVLDEPATNLHPAKQRAFARLLTTRLRAAGVQLFVITHAPSFVDRQNLRGLIRVDRKGGSTRILPIDRNAGFAYDDLARQALILPNLIPMLFARKVILFEGEQEARSLPVWFRKIDPGVDPSDLGIDTGDGGGDPKVEIHAAALKKLGIPFAVVGDRKGKTSVRRLTPYVFTVPYSDFGGMVKSECSAALGRIYPRKPWPKKIGADACRRVAEDTEPPRSVKRLWRRIVEFVNEAE